MKGTTKMLAAIAATLVVNLGLTAGPVTSTADERDVTAITKKVFPSVVRVEARMAGGVMIASGVVIDDQGHIVTTAGVSSRDGRITVRTGDGSKSEADFLGFDPETRLALIRAKEKGLVPIVLGKPSDIAEGSWICLVGISPESRPAVVQGIVSSIAEDKIRLNIWSTGRTSGSPVVDEKGQMVGMFRGVYSEDRPFIFDFRDRAVTGQGYVLSRGETPASGLAQAVPVDVVKFIVAEIKEKGKVERGWLGVSIAQDDEGGVTVTGVDRQSPAELAKLRADDVIVRIDDREVTGTEMLASEIRKRRPGQDVTLRLERNGKSVDVKVKLGELPEQEARRELELRFPRLFPFEPRAPQAAPPGRQPVPAPAEPRPFAWTFETRKSIGIWCQPLTRELSDFFGLKDGQGLLVSKVEEGPAATAGLKVGDVIVRVDGTRVNTVDELIDLIQDRKKGDKLKVEILREKKPLTLEVTVDEEESRGPAIFRGSPDEFLESWQKVTDAFERELRTWDKETWPKAQEDMKRIREELARQGKVAAK
ncbi:MAG: PDZ domain-containing protein, partial [Candidatus Aminicenantes bacterium]|nr:PDZ domain-containing protein [Candidatus Aminicenantes bacterium]